MAQRLTDKLIREIPRPATGNRIHYDDEVRGFGVRITAKGSQSFILNYRIKGRERRYTIGEVGAWKTVAARQEAKALKVRIDRGDDPLGEVQAARAAPTMAELCKQFELDHFPHCRPLTQRDYRRTIQNDILPALGGSKKVEAVTLSDVRALHRKITDRGAKYAANRAVAVLSKMFSFAAELGWRSDNPATSKLVKRNHEEERRRYLTPQEIMRLCAMLTDYYDQNVANIIRLLLLTGARRGEVMKATWKQFDLDRGVWTKPASNTKQKKRHSIPLSEPALQLLKSLRASAAPDAEYLFPGRDGGHLVEIKRHWEYLRKAVGIEDVRAHDLRHSFASVLASSGMSLPIIGALLGHSQPKTTARYAHLYDDTLRHATERAGAIISGAPSAGVVSLRGGE